MNERPLLKRDELFRTGDSEKIWRKYCGFLDLSLDEVMAIQRQLLMEQMELVGNSGLGQRLMKGRKPHSVEEFRRVVALTAYKDYEPHLSTKREDGLPVEPAIWAHTSGKTGYPKWVPYTTGSLGRLADDTLAAFILSSATRKGEVHLHEGVKAVLNLPPVPYITGIMAFVAAQRMSYQAIPPLEEADRMQFQERIRDGFRIALHTGADYAASIAVVLAKVGESFGQLGNSTKFSRSTLHPMAMFRLLRAVIKSKLTRRPVLPKDLWRVKGLVCGGTDTSIYRDQIAHYWGVQPLDVYVATEAGFIAMQGWNKKGMTFVPYSNFYEFIPEEEWLKSRARKGYQPSTVLLDELEEGKTYEIVFTSFNGMPFLRYRIGDLITITSLKDEETGANLPQMVFQSRADDVIDIAGFTRLDEKTIWQAIQNIGIPYEDWSARKEHLDGKSILHIYLEAKGNMANGDGREIARLVDEQLMVLDRDYGDLRNMTGEEPVRVTLLRRGAFQTYLREKQAAGFDLAHLKPPHMSAPDHIIEDLLRSS